MQAWNPNPNACLPELLGPAWYRHDSGPVYHIGGAFVEYVLRKYGTDRFVELYLTCRPGTAADDFARVFAAHDRRQGVPTAPARGLCLVAVKYT